MARVSINIVTWNSADYLDNCLNAVYQQTFTDYSVVIVDNGSDEATLSKLAEWQQKKDFTLVFNPTNEGYAPAHNKAIRTTTSEFVLTLNPDAILAPTYLQEVIAVMEAYPQVGSVAGKLISISPEEYATQAFSHPETILIDSAGLIMQRSRRQKLRGALEKSFTTFLTPEFVFGVDGAVAFYRRAMLDNIALDGEYFDEMFVTHKEDIDLAWRAQLFGWQCYYTPTAVAYHIRGFRPGQRKTMSASVKRDAVKNRWLLAIKNELPTLFCWDLGYILWYELKILLYMLFFERTSLAAIGDTLRLWRPMWRKRQAIQSRRKVDAAYMRQWFL